MGDERDGGVPTSAGSNKVGTVPAVSPDAAAAVDAWALAGLPGAVRFASYLTAREHAAQYPRGTNTDQHFWIRLDHVDPGGGVSLRRAGRMHHLGVGIRHRGTPVLVLLDAISATVTHRTTGEVLSRHTIGPTRTYWRNTDREPGRWPGSQRCRDSSQGLVSDGANLWAQRQQAVPVTRTRST